MCFKKKGLQRCEVWLRKWTIWMCALMTGHMFLKGLQKCEVWRTKRADGMCDLGIGQICYQKKRLQKFEVD